MKTYNNIIRPHRINKPLIWVRQSLEPSNGHRFSKLRMVHTKWYYPVKLAMRMKLYDKWKEKYYIVDRGGYVPSFYKQYTTKIAAWHRNKNIPYLAEDRWYNAKETFSELIADRNERFSLCMEYGIDEPYGDEINTLVFLMKKPENYC